MFCTEINSASEVGLHCLSMSRNRFPDLFQFQSNFCYEIQGAMKKIFESWQKRRPVFVIWKTVLYVLNKFDYSVSSLKTPSMNRSRNCTNAAEASRVFETAWSSSHGAYFWFCSKLLRKRNHRGLTTQREHRKSAARNSWTQYRDSSVSNEAPAQWNLLKTPWIFVRDPAKFLLRSLCFRCALHALLAFKALLLRPYNLLIASAQHFHSALGYWSTLMPIFAVVLPVMKTLRFHGYRHYLLVLKRFTTRFSRCIQDVTPSKAEGETHTWTGDYFLFCPDHRREYPKSSPQAPALSLSWDKTPSPSFAVSLLCRSGTVNKTPLEATELGLKRGKSAPSPRRA